MYSYYFYYEVRVVSEYNNYEPEILKGIFRAEGPNFAAAGKALDEYYGDEIDRIIDLRAISDSGVLELTDESVAEYMKQLEDF